MIIGITGAMVWTTGVGGVDTEHFKPLHHG